MSKTSRDFKDTKKPFSMAEEVLDWAFGGYKKLMHHTAPIVPFTKDYAYQVAEAQRFRIDEHASITFSKMKTPDYALSDIMPFMQLPFPTMWIEFGDSVNPEARKLLATSDKEQDNLGILLKQIGNNQISAHIIRQVKTQLGFSGFVPDFAPLIISANGVKLDFDTFLRNEKILLPADFHRELGKSTREREDGILNDCIAMEEKIGSALINLLLLLNSRSEVVTMRNYPDIQDKANQKNRKLLQQGLKAKLPIGEINFNLSRILKRHPNLSEAEAYALIEDQLVSGHFKIRYKRKPDLLGRREASGIYWWSPHVRNKSRADITIGDIEPRTHNVTRRAELAGEGYSDATSLGLPTVNYGKPSVS